MMSQNFVYTIKPSVSFTQKTLNFPYTETITREFENATDAHKFYKQRMLLFPSSKPHLCDGAGYYANEPR